MGYELKHVQNQAIWQAMTRYRGYIAIALIAEPDLRCSSGVKTANQFVDVEGKAVPPGSSGSVPQGPCATEYKTIATASASLSPIPPFNCRMYSRSSTLLLVVS